MANYTIITKLSVFDSNRDFCDDSYIERLTDEQDEKLKILGFDMFSDYAIHFFDSAYTEDNHTITDIYTAIERLAIKDGVDLVQFSNGNYGYIAYYNGIVNGFEIIA